MSKAITRNHINAVSYALHMMRIVRRSCTDVDDIIELDAHILPLIEVHTKLLQIRTEPLLFSPVLPRN